MASQSEMAMGCIIAGIATWACCFFYRHDKYYTNEPLVCKSGIIRSKFEFYHAGKFGTHRYHFELQDYEAEFWIANGSLDVLNDNDSLVDLVKSIPIGTPISICYKYSNESKLHNRDAAIKVVALNVLDNDIISAKDVKEKDSSNMLFDFGFSSLLVVGGTAYLLKRKRNRKLV